MRELLAPYGVEAQSAGELASPEPDETGTTFAPMRASRRRPPRKATGQPAFADDFGLVVDALGGEPGIHSARWAGPDKDFRARHEPDPDAADRARRDERRSSARAHFVAALCLAWPDGHVEEFEGRVDGSSVWPPRGDKGFGYDPLFLPDGFDRTFGEMSARGKTRTAAQRPRAVAPRPRLRAARGGVPARA